MTNKVKNIFKMMATAFVVAIIVYSCSGKLREADKLNLDETPVQTVYDMFAVQTKNGLVLQRMEAPLMMRFQNDSTQYEIFPKGLSVFAYTEEGLLETIILANDAKHLVVTKGPQQETWRAYGNVIIHNTIKKQTMETDTLYWDQKKQEIWSDCYVKLTSPDGMMQGVGMRSDEHARNSILLNPFDSYGYTQKDTTVVQIDTANFVGPIMNF